MPKKQKGGKYARKPVRRFPAGACIALICAVTVLGGCLVFLAHRGGENPPPAVSETTQAPTQPQISEATQPETTQPETTQPVHEIAQATVLSTGDLLIHQSVLNAALQSDGSYNFDNIFQYAREYIQSADYSVANLEVTLCGTDNGFPYKGKDLSFNCPDELVDSAKGAGFDMLLTANNHSYDTILVGFKRTLEVVRSKGLATLGTYLSADETKWTIQEINGIKVGMLCYTYANSVGSHGEPKLNGNAEIAEPGLCNFFTYDNLDRFYDEVAGYLADMRAAGADATLFYIHWGEEYVLGTVPRQREIAQKLCDLGVDVILGGHPHVMEPMELLSATDDPERKTVCLYSMGNAISNQRLGNISRVKTAHTEDGCLFQVSFSKYSDGKVYLDDVTLIPCWVNMLSNPRQYFILPLDDSTRDSWQEKYDLTDTALNAANASYDRTQEIVGEGLQACRDYLAQQKEDRNAAYLQAA